MAVGKEAPVPNIVMVAAACREALSAAVCELSETIASLPATTIKRRLKDAVIVMPKGFANGDTAKAAAAPDFEIECKIPEAIEIAEDLKL
jgi:hypothetical protein